MFLNSAVTARIGRGSLLIIFSWVSVVGHAAAKPRAKVAASTAVAICEMQFGTAGSDDDQQATKLRALEKLIENIPDAFPGQQIEASPQYKLSHQYILPGLRYRTPLVVNAMVGETNMGKSTVFNSILAHLEGRRTVIPGDVLSPTNAEAGTTLRPLILSATHDANGPMGKDLGARYVGLEKYVGPGQMREPGPALLHQVDSLKQYPDQVWVDGADISVGEPGVDAGPANLEAAQRTFLPADVFYIAFSTQNYRNLAFREQMQKSFKNFGARKSVLIMQVNRTAPDPKQAHTKKAREVVESHRRMFSQMANVAYGRPEDTPNLPPEILGTYVIYMKNEVADHLEHPELVGFDGTPPFPILVDQIGSDGGKIKADGITAASASLVADLKGRMAIEIRKMHVAQIYEAAMTAVTEDLSTLLAIDFPYSLASRTFRQAFARRTSLGSALDRSTEYVFEPQVHLPDHKLTALVKPPQASIAQMNTGIAGQLARGKDVVAYVQAELRLGRVPLLKAGAGAKRLMDLITAYDTLYPGEAVRSSARTTKHVEDADEKGIAIIDLPPIDELPEGIRTRLSVIVGRESFDLANAITMTGAGQPVAALGEKVLAAGLGRIAQGDFDGTADEGRGIKFVRGLWKFLPPTMDVSAFGGTGLATKMAAPKVIAAKIAAGTMFPFGLPIVGAVAATWGLTAATRVASNRVADAYLAPRMTTWYRQLQQRKFETTAAAVFKPLTDELTSVGRGRLKHLDDVQDSLAELDPSFERLKTRLVD